MRVAFLYGEGRDERLEKVRAGLAPSEFFYGQLEMPATTGAHGAISIHSGSKARFTSAALDLLRRAGLTPPKTNGRVLADVWHAAARLDDYDCIVATTGPIAFACAIWRALARIQQPIVGIHCGLLNFGLPPLRREITARLLRSMDSMLFGEGEWAPTRRAFDLPSDRISVNQFGVDLNFWTPGGTREDFVLAVGSDGRRDYETLIAAAREIAAPVRLVTQLPLPSELPPNVMVMRGSFAAPAVSDVELRDLYRRAACVVTPLKPSVQPSGQSVTQQAMACGAPVVVTRTEGLWDPRAIVDRRTALLVEPSRPDQLAAAVRSVLSDSSRAAELGSAARESAAQFANIADFARRTAEVCERAVARSR